MDLTFNKLSFKVHPYASIPYVGMRVKRTRCYTNPAAEGQVGTIKDIYEGFSFFVVFDNGHECWYAISEFNKSFDIV